MLLFLIINFKDFKVFGKENPALNTLIKVAKALDANFDDIFNQLEIEDPEDRKVFKKTE